MGKRVVMSCIWTQRMSKEKEATIMNNSEHFPNPLIFTAKLSLYQALCHRQRI